VPAAIYPEPKSEVVKRVNMVMSPVGPGTKNDCAGSVQQQFSRPELFQRVNQNKVKQIFNKEKFYHENMQISGEERLYRILRYNLDVMSAVN
jgi:hypothetical protein